MDLTREQALILHRQMWNDMKKAEAHAKAKHADFYFSRGRFKETWIAKNGYGNIANDCFLCEYAYEQYSKSVERKPICNFCPIDWSSLTPNKDSIHYGTCGYHNDSYLEIWQTEDIDKILLLPEKEN